MTVRGMDAAEPHPVLVELCARLMKAFSGRCEYMWGVKMDKSNLHEEFYIEE